jgi:phosphohistidine phosphatase
MRRAKLRWVSRHLAIDSPVKTLIVLRHGKSDWSGGEPDRQRPLAKRGRRQVPEAGAWLAANHPDIELAVVSPAERTRSTWALAAAELDRPPDVLVDERVYAAWGRTLHAVVTELPDDVDTVVLVGHNPGVEDLVQELTGDWVPMPTSAIAVIEWNGPWSDASGARLTASGRPPA